MTHIWRPLWAIVRKDVGVWLRRPSAIAATILPALLFILVLFFAAQAVGRNPVALVVEGQGPHAQQLVQILRSSDAFNVRELTAPQAAEALRRLQVAAVITIPAAFDAAYDGRRPDPVTIQINNLNLDFTNDLRRSLPAAITAFYAQQPSSPIAVRVRETDLRPHDIGLVQFDMVPNLVLLLTIAGVVNAGLATAREWEDSTIKELVLAPVPRIVLVLGKLLAGWITALLVAAVVLALGAATGYLRPEGSYWLSTLVIVALIALASTGLGVALGATVRRFQRVAALGIPVSIYLFFLSGGISVAAFLPDWVQAIARFIPTYYGVHALQTAIFYQSTEGIVQDLTVLVATALVGVAIGVATLSRRSTLA